MLPKGLLLLFLSCRLLCVKTRWSILGSDDMTKSDCSLYLWFLSDCSSSILWGSSECSLNHLKSSLSYPEDILKSSWTWSHSEESEAKRWRLCALEHFSPDRQTNERTEICIYWAPVGANNKEEIRKYNIFMEISFESLLAIFFDFNFALKI